MIIPIEFSGKKSLGFVTIRLYQTLSLKTLSARGQKRKAAKRRKGDRKGDRFIFLAKACETRHLRLPNHISSNTQLLRFQDNYCGVTETHVIVVEEAIIGNVNHLSKSESFTLFLYIFSVEEFESDHHNLSDLL